MRRSRESTRPRTRFPLWVDPKTAKIVVARSAGRRSFFNNLTLSGGPAPVRAYIGELLPDVLEGKIEPGRVFDRLVGLNKVSEGYRAMDQREPMKVMINP